MPVLMQMILAKSLEQVLYKYRMSPEKDYFRFSRQLIEFGTERRYEARRSGGNDMDVDALANVEGDRSKLVPLCPPCEPQYTAELWKGYEAQLQEELNWLGNRGGGKGKGKGKTNGNADAGKGGTSRCLWCEKTGHFKKDCRAFAAWKAAKDEERKDEGRRTKGERQKAKDEGRRMQEEGRRAKGEGRRMQEERRRSKGEGRRTKGERRKAKDDGRRKKDEGRRTTNERQTNDDGRRTTKAMTRC